MQQLLEEMISKESVLGNSLVSDLSFRACSIWINLDRFFFLTVIPHISHSEKAPLKNGPEDVACFGKARATTS
jgi:hypothetical protein